MPPLRLVEETVLLGERAVNVLRAPDPEALIDEEAFEREEFLPYWAELWPSALALAHAVVGRDLRGASLVELGCGLGLPSIAAALAGADVLATDWSPDAVSIAALNARRNGVRIETAVVSWTAPDRLLAGAPWDLVLAADVLYERRNVDVLLELLPQLAGEVLLADPGRPPLAAFVDDATAAWHVEGDGPVYRLTARARP